MNKNKEKSSIKEWNGKCYGMPLVSYLNIDQSNYSINYLINRSFRVDLGYLA